MCFQEVFFWKKYSVFLCTKCAFLRYCLLYFFNFWVKTVVYKKYISQMLSFVGLLIQDFEFRTWFWLSVRRQQFWTFQQNQDFFRIVFAFQDFDWNFMEIILSNLSGHVIDVVAVIDAMEQIIPFGAVSLK